MKKVLFVCMGNICRSPSAEAVMNHFIKINNLENIVSCDSAGTIAYHEGENADERMQRHANKRGYKLTSIARKLKYEDLENFDYIIAMDKENYHDILNMDPNGIYTHKVSMMTDYSSNGYEEVPDPYYGGSEGFELVLDILEDSVDGLINKIKQDLNGE